MRKTILIADNNAFYRQVLGDFFHEEGYETRVAADGVEALERVSAGGIDVILLDLIMPRIDGARLCAFLKSHPHFSSIPVVILSGILADEIEGLEEIRADAYVAKMPMEQLQETLRTVFASLDGGGGEPMVVGFEKMYRREIVVEFLEERRVRETIQNELSEGIVELNDDSRILRTNRTFEEMVGEPAERLLSRPLAEVLPESREAVAVLFRDAERGVDGPSAARVPLGDRTLQLRLHRLNSRKAVGEAIVESRNRLVERYPKVRLATPEMFPGFVLLVQDVTEAVNAQKERDRFRESVARSQNMSALGHFVAGTAHELNNPLVGVLGYAELLRAQDLPGDARESLRKIADGASRCKAIVENLISFSRKSESERMEQSLNDLVMEAARECETRPGREGVEILTSLAEELPPVHANPAEILQALVAVMENAVRAAGEGSQSPRVHVRTRRNGRFLAVEVADNGRGIPETVLPRIFDPFFTTREVGQGRGLGLSVSYGIVKAHGGSVAARNVSTGGACVSISLPSAEAGSEESAGAGVGGARILIVDDEPVVLELLTDILRGPHTVETATNGREGLARTEEEAYDLIFLDIRMPDMSGRQLYEALAATRPALADRVIFTTGDIVQEDTRRFIEGTGQPCLAKPFSVDAVTEIVDRILAAARTA